MSGIDDSVNRIDALLAQYTTLATAPNITQDVQVGYTEVADALDKVLKQYRLMERQLQPANDLRIEGIPEHVRKELSAPQGDELENQIVVIINAFDTKEADLDHILVELWHRFEASPTRRFLQNKLWRMSKKNLAWSIPGRKGVYSTIKPDEIVSKSADEKSTPSEPVEINENPNGFDVDLEDEIPF